MKERIYPKTQSLQFNIISGWLVVTFYAMVKEEETVISKSGRPNPNMLSFTRFVES